MVSGHLYHFYYCHGFPCAVVLVLLLFCGCFFWAGNSKKDCKGHSKVSQNLVCPGLLRGFEFVVV